VAATAYVSHPVKQGLIQALGVFTDTLVVCSCTAFIILVSGVNVDSSYNGIQLTQEALTSEIGPIGNTFIAITILLFAYSSVIGNYYYGEANIKFITKNKMVLNGYRLMVGGMVLCGSLMSLELAWSFADLMMALLAMCNLVAIVMLSKQAVWLLNDYRAQKKRGIKSPVFTKDMMPEIEDKLVSW
jgi:AGCS family alanine or glycine:cation symporter